jgi:hypothetical protein
MAEDEIMQPATIEQTREEHFSVCPHSGQNERMFVTTTGYNDYEMMKTKENKNPLVFEI